MGIEKQSVELQAFVEENGLAGTLDRLSKVQPSEPASRTLWTTRQVVGLFLLIGAMMTLVPGLQEPALMLVVKIIPGEVVSDMKPHMKELLKKELGGMGALFGNIGDGLVDKIAKHQTLREPVTIMTIQRSVVESILELWEAGHRPVAILICGFSVCVPLIKLLMVLLYTCQLGPAIFKDIGSGLSKWSMADVFAVGMFITMLGMNGVPTGNVVIFVANLGPGFYYFAAHTLLSLTSSAILDTHASHGKKL